MKQDPKSLEIIAEQAKDHGLKKLTILGLLMPYAEAERRGKKMVKCGACGGDGSVCNLVGMPFEGRFTDSFQCPNCKGSGQLTREEKWNHATQGSTLWTPEAEILACGTFEIPGTEDDHDEDGWFNVTWPMTTVELNGDGS